jgi:isopentenyl-diphosphate delta-isomerase
MTETTNRKEDHIEICLDQDIQARYKSTGFEDVYLIHKALPEISLNKINISTTIFDHKLKAPIVIGAMTGGTKKAALINATLAEAAEKLGLAMGVGSQRVALENAHVNGTFKIVRKKAPHAFLIGNLGASEILKKHSLAEIQKAIEMIDADAFAIHLNPLQEAIQPEGSTSFTGVLDKIREIATELSVPLIIKETGAGIAFEEAILLEKAGISGIDVSGAGGTSWAAVESIRAQRSSNELHERLGKVFWDWGIPTAISIMEVRQVTELTLIASGGIRTGIEVTKALTLGANAVGIASPLLKSALEGNVEHVLQRLIEEIKMTMFLVGAKTIEKLNETPVLITHNVAEWLHLRGFKPEKYAQRRIRE